ncbi:DUF2459 domain-containing protein [Brevundimonas sp. NIBR11]|uniref:DUF2459 domain-containing protein n=1 Tax=Brevundimonas sp. NIBR11 TaxID=3015999 RepID=UPI0022F0E548|nr:DUF2459 domain-containing protein [Brevundimonas sp. NIBR11]WGM32620.1 hypothetical protein KKHFBJBL_02874 [Brevundimonas sp. NIBR11]
MRTVRAFLLAGLLGLIVALWTWTRPADPALSRVENGGIAVHVLNNGFHTDIAVPRAALEAGGGPLAEASRSVGTGDWILIGWGDAKFFVDQSPMEGRIPDGLRAFFRPGNASVVMLDPQTGDPARRFDAGSRRTLILSPEAFAGLRGRVEDSLTLTQGRPRLSKARDGDGAHFFASREHFWIGYLCNSWTARVLNAAGLPVRPLRSVTAGEVIAAVDRSGRAPLSSAGAR